MDEQQSSEYVVFISDEEFERFQQRISDRASLSSPYYLTKFVEKGLDALMVFPPVVYVMRRPTWIPEWMLSATVREVLSFFARSVNTPALHE